MAIDTTSNDFEEGMRLTCILYEGAITVNSRASLAGGSRSLAATVASEIYKGEYVEIDQATANTFAATGGLPVVEKLAADGGFIGRVIDEPQWVKVPAASSGVWATNLAGKYYRIATVEFYGIQSVTPARVNCADAAAIVPGVIGTIEIDAAATTALNTTSDTSELSCKDVASGAVGIFSFHYVPKATTGVYSALVAITGAPTIV